MLIDLALNVTVTHSEDCKWLRVILTVFSLNVVLDCSWKGLSWKIFSNLILN